MEEDETGVIWATTFWSENVNVKGNLENLECVIRNSEKN
jgi:hypothetical protein